MEGYINLFVQDNTENRRPHFKGFLKIDGVDHEFALWPAENGKKGFSGKYKPKSETSYAPPTIEEEKGRPAITPNQEEVPF